MQYLIGFVLGVVASLIAGLLQPAIRQGLITFATLLYMKLSPHSLSLTDKWTATFSEPEASGEVISTAEHIDLKQQGSKIYGRGTIGSPYPRDFTYSGEIYHDLVWGKYEHRDCQKGSTAGKGICMLEVSKDRKTMEGFCAWLDKDTKRIETSKYQWVRR
jgi:hypothetical protein